VGAEAAGCWFGVEFSVAALDLDPVPGVDFSGLVGFCDADGFWDDGGCCGLEGCCAMARLLSA
jgi:hypothetical protein